MLLRANCVWLLQSFSFCHAIGADMVYIPRFVNMFANICLACSSLLKHETNAAARPLSAVGRIGLVHVSKSRLVPACCTSWCFG